MRGIAGRMKDKLTTNVKMRNNILFDWTFTRAKWDICYFAVLNWCCNVSNTYTICVICGKSAENMSQNLMNRRIWCNTDSWCDKQYKLNQPRSILVLSLSVGIWLPQSDLCPLSLACMRPLIMSSLCFPLLRWAQFFICPLMIRDAIDREVEAVDSGESWCLKCSPFLYLEYIFSSSA